MNAYPLFSAMIVALVTLFANTTTATEIPGGIAAKNAKGDFVYYDFALKQSTVLVDAATLGNAKEYTASEDAGLVIFVKDNQVMRKWAQENKPAAFNTGLSQGKFWPAGGISNITISAKAQHFSFETQIEDKSYVFVDKKSPEGLDLLRIGFPRNANIKWDAPIFVEKTATSNSIVVYDFAAESCRKKIQFGNTAFYPRTVPFITIDDDTQKLKTVWKFDSSYAKIVYGGMNISESEAIEKFAERKNACFGCFSPDEEFFAVALRNDDESFDRIEIRLPKSPGAMVVTKKPNEFSYYAPKITKPSIYEIPLKNARNIKGLAWTRPEKGKPASLTIKRGQSVYIISGEKIAEMVQASTIKENESDKKSPTPVGNILKLKFQLVAKNIDTDKIFWVSDAAFIFRDNSTGNLCAWDNGNVLTILEPSEIQKALGLEKLPEKYDYCLQPVARVLLAEAAFEGNNLPKSISGSERIRERTNSSANLSAGPFKNLEFITENSKSVRVRTNNFAYCIVEGKVDDDLTNYVCNKKANPEEGLPEMKKRSSLPKGLLMYKYYQRQLGSTVIVLQNQTLVLQNENGCKLAIRIVDLEQDSLGIETIKYYRDRFDSELVPDVFEYFTVEWKLQLNRQPISVAGKPTTTK